MGACRGHALASTKAGRCECPFDHRAGRRGEGGRGARGALSRWVRCRCLLRPPCAAHPLGTCRCLPPPADPSPARHAAARERGRDAKNEIRDPTFSNFRGLRGKLDADPRWRREGARARGRVKPRGRTFRRPPCRAMHGSGGGDADRWDTGSETAERWGLPWGSRPPPPPWWWG